MSTPLKLKLTKEQIEFVIEMTEITNPSEAVQRLAAIMLEEKMAPADMALLIDRILTKFNKKGNRNE